MVNYRGKFTLNLSSVLYPLNQLLRKDQPWKWTQRCQQAFQAAKDSLTSSKVLVHFDPKLPVILECGASQYGIGAVISHRFPNVHERPIAYASRSLNAAEKNYSQIHKEALANCLRCEQVLHVPLRQWDHPLCRPSAPAKDSSFCRSDSFTCSSSSATLVFTAIILHL